MFRVEVEVDVVSRHPNNQFFNRYVFNCATEELMEATIVEVNKCSNMVILDSGSALMINSMEDVIERVAKLSASIQRIKNGE